ncbi:MAG: hypothetical protein ACYC7A_10650 [Thermoanaerobaculia bacterium]
MKRNPKFVCTPRRVHRRAISDSRDWRWRFWPPKWPFREAKESQPGLSDSGHALFEIALKEAESKLAADRAALASRFQLLFQSDRRIGRTDIIGSLELAPRVFASYPRDRKVLVILSDMVEDSDRFNFERETLSAKRIDAIVAALRDQGAIPDLRGVQVVVSGAMHRDNGRFRTIRDFWFRFFKEARAEMRKEDYGTTLIRFES